MRAHLWPWINCIRRQSAERTIMRKTVVLSFLTLVLAIAAGCTRPAGGPAVEPTDTPTPVTAEPATPAASSMALECTAIVRMTPEQAGAAIAAAGMPVNWRFQHTLADGTTVADLVTTVPDGVVVDVLINGGQAFVFVADPADPAAERSDQPTC
jgi:hypothetical protein